MGFDFEWLLGEDNYDMFDVGSAYEDAVYDAYDAMCRCNYVEEPEDPIRITKPKNNACQGVWRDRTVEYSGVWGGHTFTEEERQALEREEYIKFTYEDSKGKARKVVGRLEVVNYKGKNYLNFQPSYYENSNTIYSTSSAISDRPVTVFRRWCGHEFTMEENVALLAGETIQFQGRTKQGGDAIYNCTLTADVDEHSNRTFFQTEFVEEVTV